MLQDPHSPAEGLPELGGGPLQDPLLSPLLRLPEDSPPCPSPPTSRQPRGLGPRPPATPGLWVQHFNMNNAEGQASGSPPSFAPLSPVEWKPEGCYGHCPSSGIIHSLPCWSPGAWLPGPEAGGGLAGSLGTSSRRSRLRWAEGRWSNKMEITQNGKQEARPVQGAGQNQSWFSQNEKSNSVLTDCPSNRTRITWPAPLGQGCRAEGGRAEERPCQPFALTGEQQWLQELSRAGLLATLLPRGRSSPAPHGHTAPFLDLTAGPIATTPLASPAQGRSTHPSVSSHRVARELCPPGLSSPRGPEHNTSTSVPSKRSDTATGLPPLKSQYCCLSPCPTAAHLHTGPGHQDHDTPHVHRLRSNRTGQSHVEHPFTVFNQRPRATGQGTAGLPLQRPGSHKEPLKRGLLGKQAGPCKSLDT